jgi:hypothetical protein
LASDNFTGNLDTYDQTCDFCIPSWSCDELSSQCLTDDTLNCTSVNDSNSCYSQTGLASDNFTGNYSDYSGGSCDYCTPDWECDGYEECEWPSTITSCNSANDTNQCYAATGLASDNYSGDYGEFSDGTCSDLPLSISSNGTVVNQTTNNAFIIYNVTVYEPYGEVAAINVSVSTTNGTCEVQDTTAKNITALLADIYCNHDPFVETTVNVTFSDAISSASSVQAITFPAIQPTVDEINITPTPVTTANDSTVSFACSDDYGNCESNYWIKWFIDDVEVSSAENNLVLAKGNYSNDDIIIVSIKVGDTYQNSTWTNSTKRYVGDETPPTITDYRVSPTEVQQFETVTFEATCTDNVGVQRVRWFLTSPSSSQTIITDNNIDNGISSGTSFTEVGGWSFDSVECLDLGGNVDIENVGLTINVSEFEQEGGGGSGEIVILLPFGNGTFEIIPTARSINVGPGRSYTQEITVRNRNPFELGVKVWIDNETYPADGNSFISFEGEEAVRIAVPAPSGFESGDRFFRYDLDIPEGLELGTYNAVIVFEGATHTEIFSLEINVREGLLSNLADLLTANVIAIPIDTGDCDVFSEDDICEATINKLEIRIWHFMLLLLVVGMVVFFFMSQRSKK